MAKQNVTVRLDADRVRWADDYAAARRGWSRTTVFEAALDALAGDAAGGVPDVPKPRRVQQAVERRKPPEVPAKPEPEPDFGRADLGRLVRRGSDLRAAEPNVDHFEKTDDYRRAMALFREGKPWQHLMKESARGKAGPS